MPVGHKGRHSFAVSLYDKVSALLSLQIIIVIELFDYSNILSFSLTHHHGIEDALPSHVYIIPV